MVVGHAERGRGLLSTEGDPGNARAHVLPGPEFWGSDGGAARLGLPDRYVTHGKPALLREEVGLTPASVAGRVAEALLTPSGVVESV